VLDQDAAIGAGVRRQARRERPRARAQQLPADAPHARLHAGVPVSRKLPPQRRRTLAFLSFPRVCDCLARGESRINEPRIVLRARGLTIAASQTFTPEYLSGGRALMPRIIDADGHIVEPPVLWNEYTE